MTSRLVTLAVVVLLVLGACGDGSGPTVEPDDGRGALPTPQASWSPQVAGTVALLRDALAGPGYQLAVPQRPYRPSEPAVLTQAARAVLQLVGPDPDQGFVVVYDLPTTEAAASAGRELAGHVGSGFGQTNFPLDAQFSVAQVGSTLVFTWWSRERSDDPDRAQGAFDAIGSVGQAFPVIK